MKMFRFWTVSSFDVYELTKQEYNFRCQSRGSAIEALFKENHM